MDRIKGSLIDTYYYNSNDSLKKNAIYCQQIDRFILLDDYDVWITFKTANILSSKIATTVYLLPADANHLTNDNCINYTILNKTIFKRSNTADLIQSQTPTVKKLGSKNIIEADFPEDYKNPEGVYHIIKLKEYANFVNKIVFATEIANSKNWIDNKTISSSFFPDSWSDDISSYEVSSHEQDRSIFNQINSILYFSNSIEEARNSMILFFHQSLVQNSLSASKLKWFYEIARESNPFVIG